MAKKKRVGRKPAIATMTDIGVDLPSIHEEEVEPEMIEEFHDTIENLIMENGIELVDAEADRGSSKPGNWADEVELADFQADARDLWSRFKSNQRKWLECILVVPWLISEMRLPEILFWRLGKYSEQENRADDETVAADQVLQAGSKEKMERGTTDNIAGGSWITPKRIALRQVKSKATKDDPKVKKTCNGYVVLLAAIDEEDKLVWVDIISENAQMVHFKVKFCGQKQGFMIMAVYVSAKQQIFLAAKDRFEQNLRHQSKVNWIKFSDENTSYFQAVMRKRRLENRITTFMEWDTIIDDFEEVVKHFVKHFENIIGSKSLASSLIDGACLKRGKCLDLKKQANLIKPFHKGDVKKALFNIHSTKSPGLDGFGSGFYKDLWSKIGNDVSTVVLDFFANGKLPKALNEIVIYLVPKIENPSSAKDYKPIACCNTVYKFILKMICSRLSELLPSIVSDNQGNYNSMRLNYEAFKKFCNATGLSANTSKSHIYFGGVSEEVKSKILDLFRIEEGCFPLKYLGVNLRPTKWKGTTGNRSKLHRASWEKEISLELKKYYDLLVEVDKADYARAVWDKLIMPKHRFLYWKIANTQLLTRDFLSQFMTISSTLCPVCEVEFETHDHLLFTCSYAKQGDANLNAKTEDEEDPTEVTSRHKKDQADKDSIPKDPMNEDDESEETDFADPENNHQDMPVNDDAEKEGDANESDPIVTIVKKLKEIENKWSLQEQFSLMMHEKMTRMKIVIKALLSATSKTNHDAPKDNTTGKIPKFLEPMILIRTSKNAR
uniref:Reverse transcriptase zinc-binding domain-containing protein n=1 Tax=Cannabis sativa TaxID=3483 RepID=A0A803QHW6_CANSA